MNYVPNQNEKVLDETQQAPIEAVKTTLRGLSYFKMTLSLLKILQKFVPLSFCHMH